MESVLLERYRPALQGPVLELVPGGSRLTEELVHQAGAYTGLGSSVAVIGVCRQVFPRGRFVHGDIADLDQFDPDAFGVAFAGRCGIDALSADRRRALFGALQRVLRWNGLLIFSSHNAGAAAEDAAPEGRSPRRGSRLRGLRLRSSRAPMDERDLGSELLSGVDGDLSGTGFRIGRDEQEQQLVDFGFQLIECLDLDGHALAAGDPGTDVPELHYVARRPGGGSGSMPA